MREKNGTCDKYFDKFLSLDKNEIIPLSVSLHLLVCPKCRTAVRNMSVAEDILQQGLRENDRPADGRRDAPGKARGSSAAKPHDPVLQAALAQIAAAGLVYDVPLTGRVSMVKWVCGGLILILCLVGFPFTAMGKWAESVLGRWFSISFYILTGTSIAVYSALFIGSNIDFFVKKIRKHKRLKKTRA